MQRDIRAGSAPGLAAPVALGPSEEEFTSVYNRLRERATVVAHRVLWNWADAEEAVSDAFTDAFKKWETIRGLPHLDFLILRMTANKAVDEARRRARRSRLALKAWDRDLPDEDSPEGVAERENIRAALQSLSERQRKVVVLRLVAGLSGPEVAEALDVDVGTVKQHLHRAKGRLHSYLCQ